MASTNLSASTNSKQRRTSLVPCTPKRPLSSLSQTSDTASISSASSLIPPNTIARRSSISRAHTPLNSSTAPRRRLSISSIASISSANSLRSSTSTSTKASSSSNNGQPAPKKYKAALSSESRTRSTLSRAKTPTSSLEVPGSPSTRRNHLSTSISRPSSRSTTPIPGSPRTPTKHLRSQSADVFMVSEMDVTRVDPEKAIVDCENIEADESGDLSIRDLMPLCKDDEEEKVRRSEDKVLVSVRVRPSSNPVAWSISPSSHSVTLLPEHSKQSQTSLSASTTGTPTKMNAREQEFVYDEVLDGKIANKEVYVKVARAHVNAAMEGYNSVVFAYGQTCSGKTFTLTGDDTDPGITPLALRDIFSHIRRTPNREYLLRCSYLEIYNETIHDLLAPHTSASVVQLSGVGDNVILSPLREEVVTSLKGAKEVLERGYAGRRTATTDWNERSSRSHSVFRVVIESRERGERGDRGTGDTTDGRMTPAVDGRTTPFRPQTPGGTRLMSKGGRCVQTSVLSLIDLAGSERATSDKDRTREGRYINTSLLTLGSVIATLAENAAKGRSSHVPFRNSKLTRLLQPSLSGNARISVICTINPEPSAVAETLSTLGFAKRVRGVKLNAQKREIVDTEALLQRYKKEIEDLKKRLEEREKGAADPRKGRRLSEREQLDESRAMIDLNTRIQQLTKLILTSQTVDDKDTQSRPASPNKLDFDASPFQLQQELLTARRTIETQSTQILSLEAALLSRPPALPADASEKDQLITEQAKTIRELEIVVSGYEENLGEPLRKVKEDVEREWEGKLGEEKRKKEEMEVWAKELERELEKEKGLRQKLEEERRALIAFVSKFDALGSASMPTRLKQPSSLPSLSSFSSTSSLKKRPYTLALDAVPEAQDSPQKLEKAEMSFKAKGRVASLAESEMSVDSPMKFDISKVLATPNLMDQSLGGMDVTGESDYSMITDGDKTIDGEGREEAEGLVLGLNSGSRSGISSLTSSVSGKRRESVTRLVLEDKENLPL